MLAMYSSAVTSTTLVCEPTSSLTSSDATWAAPTSSLSVFAALKPDAVFYLRLGIDQLVPRVIFTRGFDYWESGMDLYPGHDMYDSFCNYQAALLAEFDRLSSEFNFQMVDAARDAKTVCERLKENILQLLEKDSRKSFMAKVYDETAARTLRDIRERPVFDTRIAHPTGALSGLAPAVARATNGNGHHAFHQK